MRDVYKRQLEDMVLSLNVDIGASAYWSEMSNIQTLDNLYEKGLLEPVTYLESIPAHLVPNKAKIESDARRRMEMQEAAGGEEVKEDAMPQMQTMRKMCIRDRAGGVSKKQGEEFNRLLPRNRERCPL